MVASIVAVAEIANVLAVASSGCDVFVQTHVQFGCLLTQMVDKDGFKVGPIVETCTFTRPEDTSVGACMIGCWDDHCQIRIATLTVDYYDELMRPVAKRPAAAASGKQLLKKPAAAAASGKQLPLPAEGEEEEKEAEEDEDGEEEEEEEKQVEDNGQDEAQEDEEEEEEYEEEEEEEQDNQEEVAQSEDESKM